MLDASSGYHFRLISYCGCRCFSRYLLRQHQNLSSDFSEAIAGPEDRLRIDHHYTFKVCISCILFDKEARCMHCVFRILNMYRLSRPVKVDRERIFTHSSFAENFSFLPPGGSCESCCVQPKVSVIFKFLQEEFSDLFVCFEPLEVSMCLGSIQSV